MRKRYRKKKIGFINFYGTTHIWWHKTSKHSLSQSPCERGLTDFLTFLLRFTFFKNNFKSSCTNISLTVVVSITQLIQSTRYSTTARKDTMNNLEQNSVNIPLNISGVKKGRPTPKMGVILTNLGGNSHSENNHSEET